MGSLKCKACNKELLLYTSHYMGWEDGITMQDVKTLGEDVCSNCHRPSNAEDILRSKNFVKRIKNET